MKNQIPMVILGIIVLLLGLTCISQTKDIRELQINLQTLQVDIQDSIFEIRKDLSFSQELNSQMFESISSIQESIIDRQEVLTYMAELQMQLKKAEVEMEGLK